MQSNNVIKRIDRITVEQFRESVRIRFTLDKKTYNLTIGKHSKETVKKAIAVANQINADILWDCFDTTLVKYGKNPKNVSNVIELPIQNGSEITIKDIWENYLTVKGDSISASTAKNYHPLINKWISQIPTDKLGLSQHQIHIEKLKLAYGKNTVFRILPTVIAACNLAVKMKLIDHNPYSVYKEGMKASTQGERSCQAFEPDEVKAILEAIRTNRFCSPKSAYKHSYYYPFVQFLALTGCRPEDAIALTQKDIIVKDGRKVIRFSKSYTHGQLKGTKTGTVRIFPINEQLESCLLKAPTYNNKDLDLLFPSFEGKYIDLHNFTNRVFKPVVKKLIELGEIENDLTTYSLRHTFITQMIRNKVDISTIANLVGNSPETILKHYLNADKGYALPELFN